MQIGKSRLIISLLFLSLALCLQALAHEKGFPEKTLKQAFPEAESFITKTKVLTPTESQAVEKMAGSKLPPEDTKLTVYIAIGMDKATQKRKSLGTVLFLDTKGRKGSIDLAVAYNLDGTVHKVVILENQDDKSIESPSFLNQLGGKGTNDMLIVGHDIKFNGDKKAAEAVVAAVKRGMYLLRVLFPINK